MLKVNGFTVFPYKEKQHKERSLVLFAVMKGQEQIKKGFLSPKDAVAWIEMELI